MNRPRAVYFLLCFVLLFGVLGGLLGDRVVLAAQESSNGSFLLPPHQEESPPTLMLSCKYPTLRGLSGSSFGFEIELKYHAEEGATFDLTATPPSPKWTTSITAGMYAAEREIGSIELGGWVTPEKVKVNLAPLPGNMPEPGDYVVTLEASSDTTKSSIDLTAVVTAKYEFYLYTATGRLNTQVTTGEDNHLSILLVNSGSAAIEDVTFLSSKPEGWSITFTPDTIDSLGSRLTREVDVIINPPEKTIAGDYAVSLKAESEQISDSLELRVTVLTSTIWGWVGILIAVAVIGGLAVLFRRLGRR